MKPFINRRYRASNMAFARRATVTVDLLANEWRGFEHRILWWFLKGRGILNVYYFEDVNSVLIIHSLVPKYLSSCINPVSVLLSSASLWSSTSGQLLIPHVLTKIFGNCSFGYSSPAAWNSLPKKLHDSSISLLSFKSMLKTHLFHS